MCRGPKHDSHEQVSPVRRLRGCRCSPCTINSPFEIVVVLEAYKVTYIVLKLKLHLIGCFVELDGQAQDEVVEHGAGYKCHGTNVTTNMYLGGHGFQRLRAIVTPNNWTHL